MAISRNIDPKDVVIVGDTREDIVCAKKFGAKAISVATGFTTLEELRSNVPAPDVVLENLEDSEVVWRIIHG